jgi:hypothetical protein
MLDAARLRGVVRGGFVGHQLAQEFGANDKRVVLLQTMNDSAENLLGRLFPVLTGKPKQERVADIHRGRDFNSGAVSGDVVQPRPRPLGLGIQIKLDDNGDPNWNPVGAAFIVLELFGFRGRDSFHRPRELPFRERHSCILQKLTLAPDITHQHIVNLPNHLTIAARLGVIGPNVRRWGANKSGQPCINLNQSCPVLFPPFYFPELDELPAAI